jgi:hypothetical protein
MGGALDDLGVGLPEPGADRVEPRGGVGHEDVDHGGQELGVPGDTLEERLLIDQTRGHTLPISAAPGRGLSRRYQGETSGPPSPFRVAHPSIKGLRPSQCASDHGS